MMLKRQEAKAQRGLGGRRQTPPMMIEVKSSRGVGRAGSPPMMIKKVVIQLRAKNILKKQKQGGWGVGGGRQPPPMMIEKVMIQFGVHFNRKGGGGGCRKPRPKTNWASRGCEKPKPESRQKPQSQKATCRSGRMQNEKPQKPQKRT